MEEQKEGQATETAETENLEKNEPKLPEVSYDIEELGPCYKRVKVKVASADTQKFSEDAYKEFRREAAMPGFRKGRVPKWLLERRFGRQIKSDLKSQLVQKGLYQALTKSKLNPIGTPEFEESEFDLGKDFEFAVKLYVRPEFQMEGYLGVEIEVPSLEVTEEVIQQSIQEMLRSKSKLVDAPEGATADTDDLVVVDASLSSDGSEIWGEKNLNLVLSDRTKRTNMLPQLVDISKGLQLNSEKTETVTIPEAFPKPEYRGKEGSLKLLVRKIQRREYPELTDDLAKSIGFASQQDAVQKLREQHEHIAENLTAKLIEQRLIEKLLSMAKMDIPDALIDKHNETRVERKRAELESEGSNAQEVLRELEDFRKASREELVNELKLVFILQYICQKDGLEVEETEVDDRIAEIAAENKEDPFDLRDKYEEDGTLDVLKDGLLREKAMNLLKQHVVVTTKSPEEAVADPSGSESSDPSNA